MTSAQERTRALDRNFLGFAGEEAKTEATRRNIRRLLPPKWRLDVYRWRVVSTGMSDALVFRLEHPGKPSLFLKTDIAQPFSEVAAEAQRLPWLIGAGIRCPRVVRFTTYAGRNWLLTRALIGRSMHRTARTDWPFIVEEAALALRRLHSVPVASCPFDNRLKTRLSTARARVYAGHVDWERFTSRGQAASALARLKRTAPRPETMVPTHGDPCLQNLLESRRRFAGFVDCGRTGLADRYHDLALACDSISESFGARWVPLFLRHYGITKPNQAKIEFYRQLDAFY